MFNAVKTLTNVTSVNIFDESDLPALVLDQQANTLIFRLYQRDRSQRYVAAAGATLAITFPRAYSIGSTSATTPAFDQSFTVSATMPYPNDDRSIWQVVVSSAQAPLVTSGGLKFVLTEGATTTTWFFRNVIRKVLLSGDE